MKNLTKFKGEIDKRVYHLENIFFYFQPSDFSSPFNVGHIYHDRSLSVGDSRTGIIGTGTPSELHGTAVHSGIGTAGTAGIVTIFGIELHRTA